MTKTLLLAILVLSTPATAGEILTNDDIIRLTNAKLSHDVIITAIATSEREFDTSTSALIHLRQQGVANEVLLAMLRANTTMATQSHVVTSDVVRLEFPDAKYRVTRWQFYKGVIRVYDDRVTFTPNRAANQQYALTIPWSNVRSMCYEEGPMYGDLHLTLREHQEGEPALRLGTDPDKIQPMRRVIADFTKQPIPECE